MELSSCSVSQSSVKSWSVVSFSIRALRSLTLGSHGLEKSLQISVKSLYCIQSSIPFWVHFPTGKCDNKSAQPTLRSERRMSMEPEEGPLDHGIISLSLQSRTSKFEVSRLIFWRPLMLLKHSEDSNCLDQNFDWLEPVTSGSIVEKTGFSAGLYSSYAFDA